MNMKTYSLCFKRSNSLKEDEIVLDINEDHYPELIEDACGSFRNGSRFTCNSCGVNFSDVDYFYIYEME
jgi:transposase-like protein